MQQSSSTTPTARPSPVALYDTDCLLVGARTGQHQVIQCLGRPAEVRRVGRPSSLVVTGGGCCDRSWVPVRCGWSTLTKCTCMWRPS